MAEEIGRFRGALGGFNRRDVAQYIEKAAKEYQEQIEALQAQLEQERAEKAALSEELEGLRSHSGDLAEQEAQVRASLEESTHSLTALRGELQVTQGKLTMAKKELGDLQAKVAQLEPMARQYEVLKDRIATVELDAHRKAQEVVSRAELQASKLRRDAAAWVKGLSAGYEALREQTASLVLRAEETQSVFEAGEEKYRELLRQAGEEQQ